MPAGIQLICQEHVDRLLFGREEEVLALVKHKYLQHASGLCTLPHSTFVKFPDSHVNRIIALPAYLGGDHPVAGIKWISSFPENYMFNLERVSCIIALNSPSTGRVETILEGSTISAARTAASAALAMRLIPWHEETTTIGIVGCGKINWNILRYLYKDHPSTTSIVLHDLNEQRVQSFADLCRGAFPGCTVITAENPAIVFSTSNIASIATTAVKPHIYSVSNFRQGLRILHISLRDFAPEVILDCENVVDDIDHITRAETSVHLAAKSVGNTRFISCTLGEILQGKCAGRKDPSTPLIFSPFGLGILDLAVANYVRELALHYGEAFEIENFFRECGSVA